MTARVEIYTTQYCGYCRMAKSLLAKKNVAFDRDRRRQRPGAACRDDAARRRRHDRAANLHRRDPCRRLRRPLCARACRRSRQAAGRRRRHHHERDLHRGDGADPRPSCRRTRTSKEVSALIREAKGKGADYVQTPEMTNLLAANHDQLFKTIADEENDTVAEELSRARPRAENLPAHRLDGDQGDGGPRCQPRLPDRSEGRDRRALRQDPHVRRQSCQRRELS